MGGNDGNWTVPVEDREDQHPSPKITDQLLYKVLTSFPVDYSHLYTARKCKWEYLQGFIDLVSEVQLSVKHKVLPLDLLRIKELGAPGDPGYLYPHGDTKYSQSIVHKGKMVANAILRLAPNIKKLHNTWGCLSNYFADPNMDMAGSYALNMADFIGAD